MTNGGIAGLGPRGQYNDTAQQLQVLKYNQESQHYVEEVDDEEDGDSYPVDQYDLVTSPNDFNTKTLVDLIDAGVIVIPGFQRNFVWDINGRPV